MKAVKEECAKENEGHEQARRERDTAAMLLQEKIDELQVRTFSFLVFRFFGIEPCNSDAKADYTGIIRKAVVVRRPIPRFAHRKSRVDEGNFLLFKR